MNNEESLLITIVTSYLGTKSTYDMTGKTISQLSKLYNRVEAKRSKLAVFKPPLSEKQNALLGEMSVQLSNVLNELAQRMQLLEEIEEEKRVDNDICLNGNWGEG